MHRDLRIPSRNRTTPRLRKSIDGGFTWDNCSRLLISTLRRCVKSDHPNCERNGSQITAPLKAYPVRHSSKLQCSHANLMSDLAGARSGANVGFVCDMHSSVSDRPIAEALKLSQVAQLPQSQKCG